MPNLGPDNAVWDDGEWVSWAEINSELYRAEIRERYPNADPNWVPLFERMLEMAMDFHDVTGRHLQIYGDIGEVYGAVNFGIRLN